MNGRECRKRPESRHIRLANRTMPLGDTNNPAAKIGNGNCDSNLWTSWNSGNIGKSGAFRRFLAEIYPRILLRRLLNTAI